MPADNFQIAPERGEAKAAAHTPGGKLRVLDLFSGIGGFSLGLERTGGFETVAFCEIDPFCRRVLAKHWPNVRQFEDVTKLRGEDVGPVDVICGGFPCQDISQAGKGAGLEGERSGLWREYARLIGELRPAIVLVENVSALLGRGLDRVLGDLAALGYDAEWHCIPASAVGAHHQRDRVWIVANASSLLRDGRRYYGGCRSEGANPISEPRDGCGDARDMADTDSEGLEGRNGKGLRQRTGKWTSGTSGSLANADSVAPIGTAIARTECDPWLPEPDVGRVANGVPSRVDRLKALGNAVVPQIPELIGRAILEQRAA